VKKFRRQWALGGTAGGAIVGLAVAMPEVTLTTTSVLQGASNIGLGLMVGTNVLSLPLLTSIA
jgi:cation:H+ antiporter